MRIGVIGTIVKDHIYLANGKEIKSFGGIYYTLSILGNILKEENKIYPICYLGADIYDEILTRLWQYKNINTSSIKKVSLNNSAVKLIYKDVETRDEFLINVMPQLEINHIQETGPMDIWLVNFITGFEMSLQTFNQFCQQQSGLIYMDFHSLSLDINEDGRRILRKLPNWDQWIRGVDVLQMNDVEAATLCESEKIAGEELIELGHELIEKEINIVHITRGSKGSLLFYRDNHQTQELEIPAAEVEKVVDVTGCGDAFAAGFLVHYYNHKDIVAATRYANAIAGVNCTIRGTEELHKLKNFLTKRK